jgi:hypothetical protein
VIVLDATTKSLEVKLAGAITTSQLPIVASFADVTSTTFVSGASQTATNSTTAVTAVAAPGASTQRHLKSLFIRNSDTASATVTVQINDNGTLRILAVVALATLDILTYEDGAGFRIFDSSGAMKFLVGAATSATQLATARLIYGNSFNGTVDLAQVIAATFGGTGSAYFTVSGPSASRTYTFYDANGTIPSLDSTSTWTNKRNTRRITTETDAATVTFNADTTDLSILTELSQTTTFANPTGTPTNGQLWELRAKVTTTRSVLFGNQFRGSTDLVLPTNIQGGKTSRYLFEYNSADTKWDYLAKNEGY